MRRPSPKVSMERDATYADMNVLFSRDSATGLTRYTLAGRPIRKSLRLGISGLRASFDENLANSETWPTSLRSVLCQHFSHNPRGRSGPRAGLRQAIDQNRGMVARWAFDNPVW
jgi:hypothetical protein